MAGSGSLFGAMRLRGPPSTARIAVEEAAAAARACSGGGRARCGVEGKLVVGAKWSGGGRQWQPRVRTGAGRAAARQRGRRSGAGSTARRQTETQAEEQRIIEWAGRRRCRYKGEGGGDGRRGWEAGQGASVIWALLVMLKAALHAGKQRRSVSGRRQRQRGSTARPPGSVRAARSTRAPGGLAGWRTCSRALPSGTAGTHCNRSRGCGARLVRTARPGARRHRAQHRSPSRARCARCEVHDGSSSTLPAALLAARLAARCSALHGCTAPACGT